MNRTAFLLTLVVWTVLFVACGINPDANDPAPMPVPAPPTSTPTIQVPTGLTPLRIYEGIPQGDLMVVNVESGFTVPFAVNAEDREFLIANNGELSLRHWCGETLSPLFQPPGETWKYSGCTQVYTFDWVIPSQVL